MRAQTKIKKSSSRVTKKKGIKKGNTKNNSKTKRTPSISEKRTRRKTTIAHPRKKLKTRPPTQQVRKTSAKKQIVVRRSSGRIEKFDTARLAQTVSRSGVPFLMARDIAKKATRKIKSRIRSSVPEDGSKQIGKKNIRRGKESRPKPEPVVVTASQVRNLVVDELQERNRPDIASSYTGSPPEHYDQQAKPTIDDKEPIIDIVAANMNKVLHDPSKREASA